MDAIKDIEAAGLIPDIYLWAEGILRRATDASQFGTLIGNVLSADGIAYLMCYTDEATTPALYQDMNTKCYAINRSSIQPYGRFLAGMLKHVRRLKPYPNSQVFRGVKADLRSQYPKGRIVVWYGCCSCVLVSGPVNRLRQVC